MIRYSIILAAFLLFGCGKDKQILLPKSGRTIVKEVADISPIYMLFQVNGNDTLLEVDKQTIISTTNWVFNIDKRFPLKKIMPEVIKLQNRKGSHKGEAQVENYYSYADSIGKNMAFIPFTDVVYTLGTQKDFAEDGKASLVLKFDKQNQLTVNGIAVKPEEFHRTVEKMYTKPTVLFLHFDKELSYDNYIADKILLSWWKQPNVTISNKEYIY
ncbi:MULTISPECIES: hypothetical protein [unclassified Flavobacterium]|uniref:hypothetical protein n=1 Tax=unclassified Flavobacterium TaxID=196869 RepID=UPI0026274DF9|nr:hypothetical protein [Flavobacterium sp.]